MNKFWNIVGTVCGFYIVVDIIFAILHEGGYSTPFSFSQSVIITGCDIIFVVVLWIMSEIFKYTGDR